MAAGGASTPAGAAGGGGGGAGAFGALTMTDLGGVVVARAAPLGAVWVAAAACTRGVAADVRLPHGGIAKHMKSMTAEATSDIPYATQRTTVLSSQSLPT